MFINELYQNFTPSFGLPENEFIELFNASNKIFELEGWVLSDGTSNVTLGNFTLRPGEYLIVCLSASEVDFLNYGAAQGVVSFPKLKNDDGNALEQINPLRIVLVLLILFPPMQQLAAC